MLTTALGKAKFEGCCAEIKEAEPYAEMMDLKLKDVRTSEEVPIAVEAMGEGETSYARFFEASILCSKFSNKSQKM